jgi:hypothetical protein
VSEPDLSVFVEFGVGLAGFSGVVVAFGRGDGRLGPYDRFRVVQLLTTALVPAFLALLPIGLAGFGVHGEPAARVAGAVLIAAIAINLIMAIVMARRMPAVSRRHLSPTVWRVALASSFAILLWNGLNLAGWPGPTSFGPVMAGMAWSLFMASVMFFRLILVRIGDEDEEEDRADR